MDLVTEQIDESVSLSVTNWAKRLGRREKGTWLKSVDLKGAKKCWLGRRLQPLREVLPAS